MGFVGFRGVSRPQGLKKSKEGQKEVRIDYFSRFWTLFDSVSTPRAERRREPFSDLFFDRGPEGPK